MITKVSASQVKTYNSCPRRWYIENVLGEKPTEIQQHLIDGQEVHTEIEAYLPTGVIRPSKWQEHVALAAPLLPAAPVPASVQIEAWLSMPTYSKGPKWNGRIDVFDVSQDRIKIYDHKTTKAGKYNLKPEELGNDVQMASYGYWALTSPAFGRKNRSAVDLQHTYIRIGDKAKATKVEATVSKEQIFETHHKSLKIVREMCFTAASVGWKEVSPNTTACDAYGGCPFQERCGTKTIFDQLKIGGRLSMGLLDRLNLKAPEVGHDTPTHPADGHQGIIPPDAPPRTTSAADVEELIKPKKGKTIKKEAPEQPPVAEVKAAQELELYVDCYPLYGERPTTFNFILAPILAELEQENGVDDIRFIKYDAKARLSVALRKHLDALPPRILVTGMSTYADTFMEVVGPRATRIVTAIKGII